MLSSECVYVCVVEGEGGGGGGGGGGGVQPADVAGPVAPHSMGTTHTHASHNYTLRKRVACLVLGQMPCTSCMKWNLDQFYTQTIF